MNCFKQLHLVPFLFSLQFIFRYAAISGCPVHWSGLGNQCYLQVDTKEKWTEANNICKRYGGQLAKIETKTVNLFLLNLFLKNGKGNHWFGLHRCGGNKWCFPDGNYAGPFSNWDSGEPNNAGGNEGCAEILSNGHWNDLSCSSKLPYICQKNKGCPVHWSSLGNQCYLQVYTKEKWTEANKICKRYGGQLAKIETKTVNSFLLNLFLKNGKGNHWFGLHRCGGNKWCFPDGNYAGLFSFWDSGEPNNAGGYEGCAEIRRNGHWNDVNCSSKLPYICQKNKVPTATRPPMIVTTATRLPMNVTTATRPSMNVTAATRPPMIVTTATRPPMIVTTTKPPKNGSCPPENVGTTKGLGVLSWPETIVGNRATIPCPNDRNSSATRECRYKDKTFREISWEPMNAKACPYNNNKSQSIFDLSEKNVNSSSAIKVGEEIKILSFPGNHLIPEDVTNTASILEKIAAVKGKANEVADNFFDTIDNILNAPLDVVIKGQRQTNSSLRIVQSLNTLLERLNITKKGSFRKTLKNFAVDLSIVSPGSFDGITFAGIVTEKPSSPLTNDSIVKEPTDNKTISQAKATTIRLPRSLFDEATFANSYHPHTVLLALYKETKFFQVLNSSRPTNFSQRLNSYVIAGSIKNQTVSNLKIPIVLTYPSLKLGDRNSTLCGFWNFSWARWSNEGCTFRGLLEDGRIVCHCNHLTNFAMLMDIHLVDDDTSHEEILGLISYIGCALSLVGLVLTIITILLFKDLRSKTPNQILLNFCVALSLTLIVFLAAAERSKTSSMATCRAGAVALHYFVLVVFMWMAIQAFNMYLAFVKVIPSHISKFILKCCVVAWGIPAVIISITVGVALGYYGDNKYCRLRGLPFYVAFLTPVLLILFTNSITFVLIFRSLLLSGNKVTAVRKRSGFQQCRQGAAIVVLLGLTWLFGVLAISDAKLVFQYLFCIFNSLQGLLVFVFFCVVPSGTRNKYKTFLPRNTKKGKSKKRRQVYTEADQSASKTKRPGNLAAMTEETESIGGAALNKLSCSSNVYSFTNSLGQHIEFQSYVKKED